MTIMTDATGNAISGFQTETPFDFEEAFSLEFGQDPEFKEFQAIYVLLLRVHDQRLTSAAKHAACLEASRKFSELAKRFE